MKHIRPSIMHIINSLSLGGAELLLKNTLQLLPGFNHTVVCLSAQNDLVEQMSQGNIEVICIERSKPLPIWLTILKLRKIILEKQPALVHSHLFYSTICARLATPRTIPLVSTLHSVYSKDNFQINFKSLLAARLTLKKRHTLIGVSHYVLEDYFNYVPFKGKRFVVHNFLPDDSFAYHQHRSPEEQVKLVAVGNLKEAKNYRYLLQIVKQLKNVSLDIYGTGGMEEELRNYIQKEKLAVRFCGSTVQIPAVFRNYDFFVQASCHEGFGLSVVEAMASGIPVLLSDIPVFREVTNGLCRFFPLDNPAKAAALIQEIFDEGYPAELPWQAFEFVRRHYSAERYRHNLLSVYEQVCGKQLAGNKNTVSVKNVA